MAHADFDAATEQYRAALQAFPNGDPAPVLELFSQRDDVTLANPLGPPCRGRSAVEKAATEAAANFTSGAGSCRFEDISRYSTPELGYLLEIEHAEGRLAATGDVARLSLRVTTIFRLEEDTWKVAHRHADPLTGPRPISAIAEA